MKHLGQIGQIVFAMLLASIHAHAQGNLDGIWKGKTSQGREFVVAVKGGAVSSIKLGFSLKLDSPCAMPGTPIAVDYRGGEAETTFGKPVMIAQGSFSVTSGLHDVDAKISGKFSGDTVKGAIELQASANSGCSGKDVLTWSATRAALTK